VTGAPVGRRWASPGLLAGLAVCAAAILPYLRTIPDYFIQDDFGVVQLLARKPWSTFPRWFTMPWMEDIWGYTPDEIRPFPALSYQITALWGAAAPEGHHVLNIALHAGNALLVAAVARAGAGLPPPAAAFAGIVFGLLPVAGESVAWVTGRVDTMPALFYLAAFLAYVRWRQRAAGSRGLFLWSLSWFFLALFSKQNTVTMVAALAAYDLVVLARPPRLSWRWAAPYLPFVLMTVGFLALRFVILGEVLRESQLSWLRVSASADMVARHLQRIVFGHAGPVSAFMLAAVAAGVLASAVSLVGMEREGRRRAIRTLAYFGPIWLALGLAPVVAAGYESPRHAYLAAAGWAIVLGIAADAGLTAAARWTARPRAASYAVAAAAGAIAVLYGIGLHGVVSDWRQRARVSRTAAAAVAAELQHVPDGALLLVGVPIPSWEWAVPFAVRPPYTASDHTGRVSLVTPERLHCCRGPHWERETRRALADWKHRGGGVVVALLVDAAGQVRRLTSREDPDLRTLPDVLAGIPSRESLDQAIVDILRKIVAGRGAVILPADR
jgi:hypothetical protein